MKKLRIYIDTSVLGGCFDPEFEEWSNQLIDALRNGHYKAVLSAVTAAEVEQAPEEVRNVHDELVGMGAELLSVSTEAMDLLAKYKSRRILGPKFQNDMLHIALATAADADVLVSWNFRHIVRIDRIRLFNAVNIELGYKPLAIYSPREVVPYETNE
ncbi:MAG: PIN domain-containing protein [Acidobacteria bacterium]|nr:PIN domain-containing protein [Acidobacteriota bacterium]